MRKLIFFVMLGVFVSYCCEPPLQADQVVVAIIAQNDDAEEDITGPDAGNVRRTSSDLEIGNENGVEQWIGLRFQAISIPPNSTINSASIRFTATDTDVGNLLVPIVGERSLNPVEFGDATPLTTRVLTLQSVIWDPDPWFPGNSGPNTTTANISTLVAEIVSQPGWTASPRSMVFLLQNDPLDTSERLAVAWDGNPAQAAVLTIDFTPGGGVVLGDVNRDGIVNLLDVSPFVTLLTMGLYQAEADINLDNVVNLLDVSPFVNVLTGG